MQDELNPKYGQDTLPPPAAEAAGLPGHADAPAPAAPKRLPLWTAAASYGVGYLYVASFLFGFALEPCGSHLLGWVSHGWAKLLFALVFFFWGSRVLSARTEKPAAMTGNPPADEPCKNEPLSRQKGLPPSAESWFWLACGLTIAAAIAFGRCRATELPAYLALHGIAAYWVLCRAGLLSEAQSGPFFLWDVFNALVVAPFGGIFLRAKTLFGTLWDACLAVRRRRGKKLDTKNIWLSLFLILLALPVLVAAGNLLSGADAGFAAFWQGLGDLLRFQWPELPRWVRGVGDRFLWSLPVGAYLYGLVGGSLCREKTVLDGKAAREHAEGLRVAPTGGLNVIFALFCGLYLVFFIIQAGRLFGAFFGTVPGQSTAAEYAREGFFQLCQVMAINFGLLAAAAKLSRAPLRQNRVLKFFTLLLMGESLLLAITAGSKLWLYIDRFGFTARRLLSFWAVLVLAAGCIFAIASTLKPCRAIQKWIWFAAATFTLLCLY